MASDHPPLEDDESTWAVLDRAGRARDRGQERLSLVLFHRDGVQAVPLAPHQELTVGRSSPADLVVSDPTLSRRHAKFEWRDDGVYVEDLGSTNGTEVNGSEIQRARVTPGAEIYVGSVAVSLLTRPVDDAALGAIESHDRFSSRLEQEVVRARSFRRPLAVLMLRATSKRERHVSRWMERLQERLRAVDFATLYGSEAALVVMPELSADDVRGVAASVVEPRGKRDPRLVAGVVTFPESGTSAEELVERARTLAFRARPKEPVRGETGASVEQLPQGHLLVAGPAMQRVQELVGRVASSMLPVLIQGETGTGKELVARAVHEASPRSDGPLCSINCAAIPPNLLESTLFGHERGAFTGADRKHAGIFEQADGGTVFLDEIGELSASAQAALLRVLETKRIVRVGGTQEIALDVRVVTATHRDLDAMSEEGTFRRDLMFRLNAAIIGVPPLRDRPEEVEPLARHFLAQAAKTHGRKMRDIDPDALEALRAYEWPGNVREVRNVIERAVVIAEDETITLDDLSDRVRRGRSGRTGASATLPPPPPDAGAAETFRERVQQFERDLMADALRRAGGNKSAAARLLQMPRRTFMKKLREYGLSGSDEDE